MRYIKTAAFATLAALLLSLCMPVAWAAPETLTVTVPAGDDSFTIELAVDDGDEPYAGIEFGLTIDNENALRFASFAKSEALSGAQESPFVTARDVHYFGFFTNANTYSGRYTVGMLTFDGYTGSETVTLTLSHRKVVRLLADGTTAGQDNTEDVVVITVRRAGSGGSGSSSGGRNNTVVVDVPGPDTPAAGDRELYSDVTDPDAWYYDAVYFVTDYGLMNGTGGGKFSPERPMTRAMFVTVLGRLAEKQGEEVAGFSHTFQDVPAGQWYTPYVAWAAGKGIVQGHSPTRFAPDETVTREQMAALIIRFCDALAIELGDDIEITFSDAGNISGWAEAAVVRAAAAGLMQGSNGRFRPLASSTRAEIAQLMMNFVSAYLEPTDQS
ncbi:MAG: S-layer homology domain-containing protein [Oscillospiraceae bacterium]|jgi:hypothetical protein|nr:S-layer homology domain-containing protein [Oscillospiraceae bacterium]